LAVLLSGCSTISDTVGKYWPRAHDPVLVDRWVTASMAVSAVDCSKPTGAWSAALPATEHLYLLAEFRKDPQTDNLRGLRDHVAKINTTANPKFCELGRSTARARLAAAQSAWQGR
jgi:hypothetical protein